MRTFVPAMLALALALAPVRASAQSEEATTTTPRTSRPLWPWAIVATGGLMLASAGVTGGLTLAREDELELVCTPHSCPPSAAASQAEGRALAFSTDALWVGGLVVVALGSVLLLSLPSDVEPVPSVACGLDGCVFGLGGTF